jgi:hypothetical protein
MTTRTIVLSHSPVNSSQTALKLQVPFRKEFEKSFELKREQATFSFRRRNSAGRTTNLFLYTVTESSCVLRKFSHADRDGATFS